MVSPLTDRDRELLSREPVSSHFPLHFANGARWNLFSGCCDECGGDIPADQLRGSVNRPLPEVAVIEAVGVCAGCSLVTRFMYRLHSDLRITGVSHGQWREWSARPNWWKSAVKALRRWLKR
jgi:hypothetical protein